MKFKRNKHNSIMKSNAKPNPFEMHINRNKHQVLGRKLKSDRGMPGISRHKAFKKRKDTLLQEYKMRHKTNNFIDQRIGERNSEMTEDDKIMARFTAERVRMFNKKTMYNLSDSEVLTHRGQTLSEIERFEDIRSDDDDDDDLGRKSGALRGKFVGDAHFGGGMLTKSKHDRESLIDELINESKKRKAERQRNKEETLEATEKLDEDWKILVQITTSAGKDLIIEPDKKTNEDGYDIIMRQLKFEPHGQPSQRLKTDEEIIKEDKEKLEKLEHERLKQLREIEAQKTGYHRSSDDIDDDFLHLSNSYPAASDDENDDGDSQSSTFDNDNRVENDEIIDESTQNSDVSEEHMEYQDDVQTSTRGVINTNDDSSGGESNQDSSDEECAMEDLTDLMPSKQDSNDDISPQVNINSVSDDSIINKNKSDKSSDTFKMSNTTAAVDLDLPYVLEVPVSFEEFKHLLQKHSIEEQNLIFERLLKSNHPTLEPANKKKILQLADYIIQYAKEGTFTIKDLPNMTLHFSIFKEFNKEECLNMLVESISSTLEQFDNNTTTECTVKFLIWYTLLFVKPQGIDVLLPINKPAINLLCKIISETNTSSKSQVKISLLCSYLLLEDAKTSFKIYIEALTFLGKCLNKAIMIGQNHRDKEKSRFLKGDQHIKSIQDWRLPFNYQTEGQFDSIVFYLVLNILVDFVKTYRKYPQSKIMFKTIYSTINDVKADTYPQPIETAILELKTLMDVLQTAKLPPMVKAAKKPKALRQYEPVFHIVTDGKRSLRGLPVEKQEEQKLLHKYKTEMKGAMRELRRDRVFLANVKLGEKARSDAERIKKVKEIYGSAAAQQGELRSLKRKK